MPKPDKDGRLLLPKSLLYKILNLYEHKDFAVCYTDGKRLCLLDSELIKDEKVVSFIHFDQRADLFIPKEALEILGVAKDDMYIIYFQHGKIFIETL